LATKHASFRARRLLSTNNFGMLNLTKSEGAALLKQM